MQLNKMPLVSVIVPSYNEELDIEDTLKSVINLRYPCKEIIVVDDSTDNTPNIIKRYEKYGVKMFRQKICQGLDGAYNLGIMQASGEIVVLLTADNRPEPDFIEKILKHYQQGADFVVVESKIINDNYLFPRFLDTFHRYKYITNPSLVPLWSEGFSCKRQVAINVGMFPEGFPFPIKGGTDNLFGEKLSKRYRKVFDRSIVMYHVAPSSFKEFWNQQKMRGICAAQSNFLLKKYSLLKLLFRTLAKSFMKIAHVGLYRTFKISLFSPKKKKDWIPFWYAYIITNIAQVIGEWIGLIEILQNTFTRYQKNSS